MNTFQFELVSPERLLFTGAVESVVVPGTEGDFEVLAHHMPVMSTIRPGLLQIFEKSGTPSKQFFLRGGFAEVNPQRLTILAEHVIPVEDLTATRLQSELEVAEADLSRAQTDVRKSDAAQRIGQLKELRRSLARL